MAGPILLSPRRGSARPDYPRWENASGVSVHLGHRVSDRGRRTSLRTCSFGRAKTDFDRHSAGKSIDDVIISMPAHKFALGQKVRFSPGHGPIGQSWRGLCCCSPAARICRGAPIPDKERSRRPSPSVSGRPAARLVSSRAPNQVFGKAVLVSQASSSLDTF